MQQESPSKKARKHFQSVEELHIDVIEDVLINFSILLFTTSLISVT